MAVKLEIPEQVEWILNRLRQCGYEAYIVGGCVRDALLGRKPGDWDITTSALPAEVKKVFGRTVDTGLQHGTVTVMRDHVGYEITTYRIDGEYEDGRHPKEVAFTRELKEDLRRRDFTINAMAYSHETGLVDIFGGEEDLKNGVIRCVGKAHERFTEDVLRILRAIRFSAQLNFKIEEETWDALCTLAPGLVQISRERIQTELTKTLLSDRPEAILKVEAAGMSPYIVPGFSEVFLDRELKGRLEQSRLLPAEKALRWSVFLAKAGEKNAAAVLRELKMDNDTIRKTEVLVRWFGKEIEENETAVRRAMSAMDDVVFDWLLELKEAAHPENTEHIRTVRGMALASRGRGECIRKKQLAVTGNDLIRLGFVPGPDLGQTLDVLFEEVLENPGCNNRQELLARAESMLGCK